MLRTSLLVSCRSSCRCCSDQVARWISVDASGAGRDYVMGDDDDDDG
jgi:hypothetical protein